MNNDDRHDETGKPVQTKTYWRYKWLAPSIVGLVAVAFAGFLLLHDQIIPPEPNESPPASTQGAQTTEPSPANGEAASSRIKITALSDSSAGIAPDSTFRLSLPKGISLSLVEKALRIQPIFGYKLVQQGEDALLTPDQPLASGQVYRFEVEAPEAGLSESFAFQTRQDFRVDSTLPAHQGTGVPVNTGIEIRFSATGFEGIAERFTLVPLLSGTAGEPVTGRWEIKGDTAAFIPDRTLLPGILYQATLQAGVRQSDAGQEIGTDSVFVFQTAMETKPEQNRRLYLADTLHGVTTRQVPVLPVYCDEKTAEAEWSVTVWRYPDADRFKAALTAEFAVPWWSERALERMPETTGLIQQASLTTKLLREEYETELVLPDMLPEGWYVVSCRVGDLADYAFIQVQDMTLYLSVAESNTLAWVHDGVTRKALPDISLTTDAGPAATTDDDGVALLTGTIYTSDGKPAEETVSPLAQEPEPLFLNAFRPGRSAMIVPIIRPNTGYRYGYRYESGYWGPDGYRDIQLRNWHYLFMDRSVYLPADTLSYWGVVQPRDGGAPPDSLTVSIVRNDGWSNDDGWVLQTQTLLPGAGGVYSGSVSFLSYESGGYNLVVRDGDIVTDRQYFSISRYEKPVYVLGAEVDQKIRMPGETVSVSLSGRFFEGTPVPGLVLNTDFQYEYGTLGEETVQLDAAGNALVQAVVPDLPGEESWWPRSGSFYARTRDPEEAENSQYASFTVFPRDIIAWMSAEVDKEQLTFSVHAHRLDKGMARKTDPGLYMPDPMELPYLGAALDHPFEISLFEHYWDRRVVGKGYDPVNKLTFDKYEYFEVDRRIAGYAGKTSQGEFAQQVVIPGWQKGRMYRLELRCVDEAGRAILETLYPEGSWGYFGYGGMDQIDLRAEKQEGGFRVGETVSLDLTRNGIPVETTAQDDKVLCLLAREGHLSWEIKSAGTWQFPFQADWIPNLTAKAILWNETGIRETETITLPYDRTEEALQVLLKTDEQTYRPGQQVQVDLQVLDAAGNPVQADVNLAVVDEAYFALYPQEVDPLGALYEPVFNAGILYTFISNATDAAMQGGAEGAEGGEGDDSGTPVRKAFRDTAWFESLKTDASGSGQASFRLPDNLTTFRLTAQAVTADLQAGHVIGQTITKLPFFVQPVLQSVFLEGDAPTLLLRAYEEEMTQPGTDYEVTLVTGSGEKREWHVTGEGQAYVSVPLGALPEGSAVVTMRATNGLLTDAVERTLRVEKNLLTTPRTLSFPIVSGQGIPQDVLAAFSGSGNAILMVTNRQGGLLQQVLWGLYGGSGMRVDRVLGRQLAAEALRDVYEDPSVTDVPEEDFSLWQQADGGVALLPSGSSDTLLSAKLCSVAADQFDRTELRRYFEDISADAAAVPERAAAALWGRAALGDPVLLEIRSLLVEEVWKDEHLLIFGLALADLGDRTGAVDVLDKLLAAYGRDAQPLRWLELGQEREDILRNTALAAMLAQKTGRREAEGMFRYVMENESRRVPLPLEQLTLIQDHMSPVVTQAGMVLEGNGENKKITLSAGAVESIYLEADVLSALRFKDVEGELEAMVISRVGTSSLSEPENAVVSIDRAYFAEGAQTNSIQPTDAVEVVLTISFSEDAPKGGYSLSDLLPAGLRFTGGVYSSGDDWCWWQPDGREIRTALYHRGGASVRTLRYRARVSGAGTFTAEAPVVRHDDSDAGGMGTKATVTVKAP